VVVRSGQDPIVVNLNFDDSADAAPGAPFHPKP